MATNKPKDLKYEEVLLHKRLEYYDKLKDALKDDDSLASLSVDVLTSIIDGQCPSHTASSSNTTKVYLFAPLTSKHRSQTKQPLSTLSSFSSIIIDVIKEVALEVHRGVKTGVDDLSDIRQNRSRSKRNRQSPSEHEDTEEPPVAKRTRSSGGGVRITNKTKSKTDISSSTIMNIIHKSIDDPIAPTTAELDTTNKPIDKKKISGKLQLILAEEERDQANTISTFETATANGADNGDVSTQTAVTTTTATAPKGQMVDVFGNIIQPIALDPVICPNCTRKIAAGRFAPHLDKCTGRGRLASRVAQHRIGTLAMDL